MHPLCYFYLSSARLSVPVSRNKRFPTAGGASFPQQQGGRIPRPRKPVISKRFRDERTPGSEARLSRDRVVFRGSKRTAVHTMRALNQQHKNSCQDSRKSASSPEKRRTLPLSGVLLSPPGNRSYVEQAHLGFHVCSRRGLQLFPILHRGENRVFGEKVAQDLRSFLAVRGGRHVYVLVADLGLEEERNKTSAEEAFGTELPQQKVWQHLRCLSFDQGAFRLPNPRET